MRKEFSMGANAPEYTKLEPLFDKADYVIWKCPKCNRRYLKQEIRHGNVVMAKIEPHKKNRYRDCCINEFNIYVNTRWRGRISRVVCFEFEPVNNHYWNLDILFPKK